MTNVESGAVRLNSTSIVLSIAAHGALVLLLSFSGGRAGAPGGTRSTVTIEVTSAAGASNGSATVVTPAPGVAKQIATKGKAPSPKPRGVENLLNRFRKGSPARPKGRPSADHAAPSVRDAIRDVIAEARSLPGSGAPGVIPMRKIKLEHRLEVQPQPRRTDRAKPASALSDRDIREIQERIASLETEFRRCYERALLVDEKISGVARLLFEVGADRFSHGTRVRFQGGGSPKGHSQLESCLSETAGSIRFPDSAASRRFEFAVQMRT